MIFAGVSSIETSIARWNNTFPFDKWWRDKYKIPFGSPQHLEMSPIHMFFEFQEREAYLALEERIKLEEEKDKLYKEGTVLTSRSEEPEDILFDKVKF